jgi:hypothetical protein
MINQEGKTLLTKIILVQFIIFIYIILTSSIINYRTEDKLTDVLVSSVITWSEIRFGHVVEITEREKRLTMDIDNELVEKFKGKILLQVEERGELWYLNPDDKKRYYLGKSNDAFRLAQKFSMEIDSEELVQYNYFDKEFPENLLGRFLIDKGSKFDMYYVDPDTKEAYLFNLPENILEVLKKQAVGMINEKIRQIEVGEAK